uniref:5-formyltetrahydrofolate cyclo-ligase n=1 Tax=Urocitellus parryii TaxID=9999 RepID=A0A8D2IF30_UROPR
MRGAHGVVWSRGTNEEEGGSGVVRVMAHSQYQNSKRISIFLSMQDEIETEEIIKDIFQQGKICFIPRYQFQSNHMDMVKLESPEEISLLPKTSWNIHQPGEDDVREEALSTGESFGVRMDVLGCCQL